MLVLSVVMTSNAPPRRTQPFPQQAPPPAHLAGIATGMARAAGLGELGLPEGWEIYEYLGKGGRPAFAVCANGRRLASGMPTAQSALRWARLLASARSS